MEGELTKVFWSVPGSNNSAQRPICVYTAIFGGYDALLQPAAQSVPCDFVCFTDADWPSRVGAWRIVRSAARPGWHPRLRAKHFKVLSHEAFPGGRLAWRFARWRRRPRYRAVIWIDGCLRIDSPDFAAAFAGHIGANGWSMFVHPDRDCIYDELEASRGMAKYAGRGLDAQVAAYRAEGYPRHAGLMACTLIARDPTDPRLPAINRAWWRENLDGSYQDQLSLPVVLWRMGLSYDPVHLPLWDNPWFQWIEHRSAL
jgi:hypothetical protein